MTRRANDFYPTPESATEILLKHVPLSGIIFEPCVGDHAIARVVKRRGKLYTNDIDKTRDSWFQLDAAKSNSWEDHFAAIAADWVVTNPPFNVAAQIVPLAFEHAREGIAMLLRLSYLEPVENRGAWLNEHPPTTLIVLPRISFTGNGKTDNVTVAWMVWSKSWLDPQRIIIAENPRFVTTQPNDDCRIQNAENQDVLGFELT